MKSVFLKFFTIFALLVLFAAAGLAAPEASQLLSTGRVSEAVTALTSHDDAQSLNLTVARLLRHGALGRSREVW